MRIKSRAGIVVTFALAVQLLIVQPAYATSSCPNFGGQCKVSLSVDNVLVVGVQAVWNRGNITTTSFGKSKTGVEAIAHCTTDGNYISSSMTKDPSTGGPLMYGEGLGPSGTASWYFGQASQGNANDDYRAFQDNGGTSVFSFDNLSASQNIGNTFFSCTRLYNRTEGVPATYTSGNTVSMQGHNLASNGATLTYFGTPQVRTTDSPYHSASYGNSQLSWNFV
jgi:hypothetical protein